MSAPIAQCLRILDDRLKALDEERVELLRVRALLQGVSVAAPAVSGFKRSQPGEGSFLEKHFFGDAPPTGNGKRSGRRSKYANEADRKLARLLYACNCLRRKKGLEELTLEGFRGRRLRGEACTSDGKPAPKKVRRP